jgi:hypothetical protein
MHLLSEKSVSEIRSLNQSLIAVILMLAVLTTDAGNTNLRGRRFSTVDLLIKVACFSESQ